MQNMKTFSALFTAKRSLYMIIDQCGRSVDYKDRCLSVYGTVAVSKDMAYDIGDDATLLFDEQDGDFTDRAENLDDFISNNIDKFM